MFAIAGVDVADVDLPTFDAFLDEVEPHFSVIAPIMKHRNFDEDGGGAGVLLEHVAEKTARPQCLTHRFGCSEVLGLTGGQSHNLLLLVLPSDRAAIKDK